MLLTFNSFDPNTKYVFWTGVCVFIWTNLLISVHYHELKTHYQPNNPLYCFSFQQSNVYQVHQHIL